MLYQYNYAVMVKTVLLEYFSNGNNVVNALLEYIDLLVPVSLATGCICRHFA